AFHLPRHRAHLAAEAHLVVLGSGLVEVARQDRLDRHAAVERGVMAVVDEHGALPQDAFDGITARDFSSLTRRCYRAPMSLRTTSPPFMTNFTRSISFTSSSGLPATAMMSAN